MNEDAATRMLLQCFEGALLMPSVTLFCVQRAGGDVLTTQLYFPNHLRNGDGPLFDPRLVMSVSGDKRSGRLEFILSTV